MADIAVVPAESDDEGYAFSVTVRDEGGETRHRVAFTRGEYEKLTGERITPEELVEKSFRFLLARESKESILTEFRLLEILRYFPEYKGEVKNF